jgi:hypothetical protein
MKLSWLYYIQLPMVVPLFLVNLAARLAKAVVLTYEDTKYDLASHKRYHRYRIKPRPPESKP